MRMLDRKLLRDLWRMRLHAIAVALVLGCGLSVFVMAVGMRESLAATREAYYAQARMADLSVALTRAPDRLLDELAAVDGVSAVETRVGGYAVLDLATSDAPASARLVSLPLYGRPKVNDLVLASGRWPDPSRANEVLINEAFASAAGLAPGDRLTALLNGRRERLAITGVANSPEFVFVSAPGELFPQPERFGVIWMGRQSLARAFDLDGAFNEAVFILADGANAQAAARDIETILASYGSTGVSGRERMMSDRFLTEELRQLATMAAFLPTFFLIVAAFLVNIALGRVIATERSNIGLMKAFGYASGDVAWHYAKSAFVLALAGAVIGSAAGILFGRAMANLYQRYYHFPELDFNPSVLVFVAAWAAALLAAGSGALVSVWRAARLAPAAALSPPRPTSFAFKSDWLGALGATLDAKSRIILRRILRFPRRAATTALGVALAIALLVVARTFPAVMDYMLDVHFRLANRQDVTLSFTAPRAMGVMHEIDRLPGVIASEPFRTDAVVFEYGGRRVEEAVIGARVGARLGRLIDRNRRIVTPPQDGVVLARALAQRLGAERGDIVWIEQTGGRRLRAPARVAAIAEPMVGASAYMELDALARLMRPGSRISGAHVLLDADQMSAFNRRIKATPALIGASYLNLAETSMRRNYAEGVGVMNLIYFAFAAVMAGGVAFSAARITLAEQERDLATLRVLGFTGGEVSYVLIGEIAALAIFAVPLGIVLGAVLARWLMRLFETDMYAFPYVFEPGGYGLAVGFSLACVLIAALVVRGGVDRLDMVGVLKARD
jgi:putative ABC transport system permease protein